MMRTTLRNCAALALLLTLVLGHTSALHAQRGKRGPSVTEFLKSSPKVLEVFREVVKTTTISTVRVRADGKDLALGTVVDKEGLILTKASQLKGKLVCLLKNGQEHEARILGIHEKFDLALIKIETQELVAVKFHESQVAPVGHWVASPGALDDPIAVGVVSVAARDLPVRRIRTPSGAPRGFLGVSMEPSDDGVKISQIVPGSGAAKAGLRVDDLILTCKKKEIDKPETLVNLIMGLKPGDSIQLRIKRGEKEIDVTAKLGKRPTNRSDYQNRLGSALSDVRTGFPRVLQHDSVVKPHECGGPLVDLDGKVIGINIARAGRTETYAVPSETVLAILGDLKSGKLAPKLSKDDLKKLEDELKAAEELMKKADTEKADAAKKLAEAAKNLEAARKAVAAARAALDEGKKSSK